MNEAFDRLKERINRWNHRRLARRRGASMPSLQDDVDDLVPDTIEVQTMDVWMPDGTSRPFRFRPASRGDTGVVKQIFEDHEYEFMQWPHGQKLMALYQKRKSSGVESFIVDAGANIGASAVFFAQKFPGAHIFGIEPEEKNFNLLALNTEGLNVKPVKGALGARPGEMFLHDPGESDWGFRVVPQASNSHPPVKVWTMNEIEELASRETYPLICKIDIEGGEAELFSTNIEWMDRYPLIVIELHDWMLPSQRTSSHFLKAVSSRDFDFLQKGENIYLFNMSLIDEQLVRLPG